MSGRRGLQPGVRTAAEMMKSFLVLKSCRNQLGPVRLLIEPLTGSQNCP